MVISLSNTYKHEVPCKKSINNETELKEKVIEKLNNLGLTSENLEVNEEGHFELQGDFNGLKFHNLLLQLEQLGLNLKMTKKTLLEFS